MDESGPISEISSDFKNQLMRALLKAEPAVLKVLVEAVKLCLSTLLISFCTLTSFLFLCSHISLVICWQFRVIVASVFVKENSWPDLVPELASVIQNSNLIRSAANCEWNTVGALTILHALIRPFQVLLYTNT